MIRRDWLRAANLIFQDDNIFVIETILRINGKNWFEKIETDQAKGETQNSPRVGYYHGLLYHNMSLGSRNVELCK